MKLLLLLMLNISLFAQERQISPNMTVLSGYGGNILYITTSEGNILIDSGTSKGAEQITKKITNVSYLLTTHRHGDHIGGNNFYGSKGATIIAQQKTAEYIKQTNSGVAEEGYAPVTFDKTYNLNVGNETMRLIYYPNAHTDGDFAVYFPKKNIIHLGDISFGKMYNYIDVAYGGTIDGLIKATEKIINLIDDETTIIPGHGDILNKSQLQKNLKMYNDIKTRVQTLKNEGKSLSEVIKARPSRQYDKFAEWSFISADKFVTQIYNTIP